MIKNQKPIDFDVHLKYLCKRCGSVHWLSFKEASTDDFKIVCDCDAVFTVKRVSSFKLKYYEDTNVLDKEEKKSAVIEPEPIKQISEQLLSQTIKALVPYGFTSTEARDMIIKSYEKCPNDSPLSLVKQTLESLRGTLNV